MTGVKELLISIADLNPNTQIAKEAVRIDSKSSDFNNSLNAAMKSGDELELRKVCDSFEQIFLQMMLRQMKASIPQSGLIKKGFACEVYENMLDERLMEEASKTGSLGIAQSLYRQLSSTINKGDFK